MSSRQKATSIFLFFCPSPQIFRYSAVWIHTVSCLYAIAAAAAVVFPNRVYAYHHNTACRFYRIHGLHIGIASILCLLQFVCYISFFFLYSYWKFSSVYISYRVLVHSTKLSGYALSTSHAHVCAKRALSAFGKSLHNRNTPKYVRFSSRSVSCFSYDNELHVPRMLFHFFRSLDSSLSKAFWLLPFLFPSLPLSLFWRFFVNFLSFPQPLSFISHHRQNSAIAQHTSIFIIFLHWKCWKKKTILRSFQRLLPLRIGNLIVR